MIVKKVQKFHCTTYVEDIVINRMTNTIHMGILLLDLSFSSPSSIDCYVDFPHHLLCILTNLHELDFSCTDLSCGVLVKFLERFPCLEKLFGIIMIMHAWPSIHTDGYYI